MGNFFIFNIDKYKIILHNSSYGFLDVKFCWCNVCPKLQTQIKDTTQVRNVLQRIDHEVMLKDGTVVDTCLIHLPCNNGVCEVSELFNLIKEILFIHFCFSITEISNKLGIEFNESQKQQLFLKAVRNTSQHTAQGELGELLLFALLETYYDAPKILTKMSLKTNRRMPYHGADGVHAQFHQGKLRLYLGESKLHEAFDGAKNDAISSIAECFQQDKYDFEFDKIETHIDFPNMDNDLKDLILNLTNPFNNQNIQNNILHTPCFIGFTDADIFSDTYDEYIKKYKEMANHHISSFYNTLQNKNLSPYKTPLLLLPFSSVEEVVKQFIKYMGITK
ncbi:MAG: DUF1837 domain-containing protein [Deferribacterales bacterium]